jgi:hypothetical protein
MALLEVRRSVALQSSSLTESMDETRGKRGIPEARNGVWVSGPEILALETGVRVTPYDTYLRYAEALGRTATGGPLRPKARA